MISYGVFGGIALRAEVNVKLAIASSTRCGMLSGCYNKRSCMSEEKFSEAAVDDASRLMELLPAERRRPRFASNSFPKELLDWDVDDIERARNSFPIVSSPIRKE
jgi:hypothetical protein